MLDERQSTMNHAKEELLKTIESKERTLSMLRRDMKQVEESNL